MNKIATTLPSIVTVAMLSTGISVIMFTPMLISAFSLYYPVDNNLLAINSPMMTSTLPALSSVFLILGLVGVGVQGLWKRTKRNIGLPRKWKNRT
jgi:p-aminobenzoyl-glutamate transporter AbgT